MQYWISISHSLRPLDDSQGPLDFHAHDSWSVCTATQVSVNEQEEWTTAPFCLISSVGYHLELRIVVTSY